MSKRYYLNLKLFEIGHLLQLGYYVATNEVGDHIEIHLIEDTAETMRCCERK